MIKLTAEISSGPNRGKELVPKRHKDGKYVASTSRFEVDYLKLDTLEELAALVSAGLSARMYSPDINNAASLITSKNIAIYGSKEALNINECLTKFKYLDDLDNTTVANVRKEQGFLRTLLVGQHKYKECCIFGELLPIELLVAAHIKPRAKCDNQERHDFENVVGLMCKIGCDDFFEKGYLCVVRGKVVINPKRNSTDYLKNRLNHLIGKK